MSAPPQPTDSKPPSPPDQEANAEPADEASPPPQAAADSAAIASDEIGKDEVGSEQEEVEEEEEEDFASMLEESLQDAKMVREGELVEGTVVALDSEVAFVDVGGKGEATIDLSELEEPDSDEEVKVGDTVKAMVVSTSGGLKLSIKLGRQAASREALADAFDSGLPVEGRVEKSIKGGFEIRISGNRAFCPISQIDTRYTEDPTIHEGQVYTFRILEFKENGKNIVLSRRVLLAEEEEAVAEQVRATLVPDAVLAGRVVSIKDYGAFVDLGGGVQGLLHVSEMGWSRVTDPRSIVQVNDEITVKILRVDEEKNKISLGLKQLQADPWLSVDKEFSVGKVVRARATRVADFGAFVELIPGIEALAHVSTFPPSGRTDGWKDSIATGQDVAVEILNIDLERKRIGVAILEEGTSRASRASATTPATSATNVALHERIKGKVQKHESYGVFVFLKAGTTGLLPIEETEFDRGDDLRKKLPVGSEIEVMVVDIDPSGRRIRLSTKAITEAQEKSALQDYSAREDQAQSGSFGSMADSLKAAFDKNKKR